ncbi:MAG: uracil-DNA glycosylase family protein [Burkholderiaceae bacterium]
MNESQRRAFDALGLGPVWRLRRAAQRDDAAIGEPASSPAQISVASPAGIGTASPEDIGAASPQDIGAASPQDIGAASPEDTRASSSDTTMDVATVAIEPAAPAEASRTTVPAGDAGPRRLAAAAGAAPLLPSPLSRDAIDTLDWEALERRVAGCRACGLCENRRQTVFGVGPHRARWMIIGEAPGAEEDAQGEPFVGQAGRLLDSMLASIGLSRQQHVFIANVLKCRPPRNRNPEAAEVASCSPYLRRQMALLDPDLIVLMGKFAASTMLGVDTSVGRLRGQVHHIAVNGRRVPAIVTYHPAYLLRDLPEKAKAWRDLQMALRADPGRDVAAAPDRGTTA